MGIPEAAIDRGDSVMFADVSNLDRLLVASAAGFTILSGLNLLKVNYPVAEGLNQDGSTDFGRDSSGESAASSGCRCRCQRRGEFAEVWRHRCRSRTLKRDNFGRRFRLRNGVIRIQAISPKGRAEMVVAGHVFFQSKGGAVSWEWCLDSLWEWDLAGLILGDGGMS